MYRYNWWFNFLIYTSSRPCFSQGPAAVCWAVRCWRLETTIKPHLRIDGSAESAVRRACWSGTIPVECTHIQPHLDPETHLHHPATWKGEWILQLAPRLDLLDAQMFETFKRKSKELL